MPVPDRHEWGSPPELECPPTPGDLVRFDCAMSESMRGPSRLGRGPSDHL
jgi:hypothetical protein